MKDKFLTAFKESLEIEDRDILMSDLFRDYPEWDSLGQLSLITMLDTEFDVQIEGKDFESLITLQDLFNEVEKRVNAK